MNNREQVQANALNEILKYNRCSLGVSMRVGKTRIAIQHLVKCFDPYITVLVVIPKLSIEQSWIDELIKMNLYDRLIPHITFTTYLSLNKHNPEAYNIVYLDECHNILAHHSKFLSLFMGKILGLTGTPPNDKHSIKYKMIETYCPIVYNFSVDEATDQNIINDYQIIIHEMSLSKQKTFRKKKKNGEFWFTSEVADYNYLTQRLEDANTAKERQICSIMRMKGLMDYETKEKYALTLLKNISHKCVVFANTTEQADRMCEHSYHSKNPLSKENLDLFNNGTINQLSCVLQLSEGITVKDLKSGILMHAYGNERKASQRIGRLLSLNPSEKAICHILCYKNTIDAKWVQDALSEFDPNKIEYFNPLTN